MQSDAVDSKSLVCTLIQRASLTPDQLAYVFLGDGEHESGRQTYSQLDAAARRIASALQGACAARARVLLLYSDGLDFLAAFFGCLYAGAIPVPTYPPLRGKRLSVCADIARRSGASAVLTTSEQAGPLRKALSKDALLAELPLFTTDDCDPGPAGLAIYPCTPQDLAFIQFTSGTTGSPKGVMVTHGNLVNNEHAVERSFEHDANTVFVGWLPLFHDMGLIGNVLQPMHLGIPAVLMPPAAFLQRPVRWLQAISKYKATTSGAPNFAYELCAARVTEAQKAGLDLRSWSVAFNGAEPLRLDTLQRFTQAFAPCGFKHEAHYPCYGMAEATLFVAGGKRGSHHVLTVDRAALERHRIQLVSRGASESKDLVASGMPCVGNEVRIVDAQTHEELPCDRVGEIWLHGPSVTAGYWGETALSLEAFGARLCDSADERRWLRTGDLGFIHAGQLYVTGRQHDMIMVRGRNLYPQDIELTAELCHPHVAKGRTAAFAIQVGDDDELVVLCEVDFAARSVAQPKLLAELIRSAIIEQHALAPQDVCVLRPSTLPVTSSGKMRRSASRELYQSQRLSVFPDSVPRAASACEDSLDDARGSGVHGSLSCDI
jgi:acyl-CoA synthetase (AMP-forming)/AMP-acid ligase II